MSTIVGIEGRGHGAQSAPLSSPPSFRCELYHQPLAGAQIDSRMHLLVFAVCARRQQHGAAAFVANARPQRLVTQIERNQETLICVRAKIEQQVARRVQWAISAPQEGSTRPS
jgi:hypothetical protein